MNVAPDGCLFATHFSLLAKLIRDLTTKHATIDPVDYTVDRFASKKYNSVFKGLDGGRTKDRTWDPFDVNTVVDQFVDC